MQKRSNIDLGLVNYFSLGEREIVVPEHRIEIRKMKVLFLTNVMLLILHISLLIFYQILSLQKGFSPKFIEVRTDLNKRSKIIQNIKDPLFADELILKQEISKFILWYESYPLMNKSRKYVQTFLSKKGLENYLLYKNTIHQSKAISSIYAVIDSVNNPSKNYYEVNYHILVKVKNQKVIQQRKRAMLSYKIARAVKSDHRKDIVDFDLENPFSLEFKNIQIIEF